jgi:hypothetical protein
VLLDAYRVNPPDRERGTKRGANRLKTLGHGGKMAVTPN